MIPGGCKMQREIKNNQYECSSVEVVQEEEMYPGGLNNQIETNDTKYYSDPVQSSWRRKK